MLLIVSSLVMLGLPHSEAMPTRENDFRDWRDLACVDTVVAKIPESFIRDRQDTASVERVPSLPIGEDYDCVVRVLVHACHSTFVRSVCHARGKPLWTTCG